MIPTLTAQQISSFAKNGFLELEGLFTPVECAQYLTAIKEAKSGYGRDLWRDAPALEKLVLSRRMSSIAVALAGKMQLRIGCDQWFEPNFSLPYPTKMKDLLSIQGLTSIFLIQFDPGVNPKPQKTTPIGLLPHPHGQGNVLIVQPTLLLSWPEMAGATGLYMVAYSQANGVYIHNPNDPAGVTLRHLGYGYGDPLKNETHPRIG